MTPTGTRGQAQGRIRRKGIAMTEVRHVIRVGNSLAITIPRSWALRNGWAEKKVTLLELGYDGIITVRTLSENGGNHGPKVTRTKKHADTTIADRPSIGAIESGALQHG